MFVGITDGDVMSVESARSEFIRKVKCRVGWFQLDSSTASAKGPILTSLSCSSLSDRSRSPEDVGLKNCCPNNNGRKSRNLRTVVLIISPVVF